MAPLAWTLRVYWKRYTFAAVASLLVARYTAKKFKDNNIIRAYCNEAKRYGEERVSPLEGDGKPGRARKVMVFLNPIANKRDAKVQFLKYSAPLLHLSGADVTVVESQSEGHLRSLMTYVDPHTDCIVVAGGDGTLMEVFTGIMRRTDAERIRSIPIGVIPLGKENRFYRSNLLSSNTKRAPVGVIGDATMDIIRGECTTPLHLMEIQPESGRLLYALSSVQWGPLRDAHENKDGFRLFGKLRLLISHLNVALRRWPTDYILHLWYPKHCRMEPDTGSLPPSHSPSPHQPPTASETVADSSTTTTVRRIGSLLEGRLTPIKAHCVRPQYGSGTDEDEKKKRKVSSVKNRFELTKLASGDMKHKELRVMGFNLSLQTSSVEEGGVGGNAVLELNAWLDGTIHKTTFIKQGWQETLGHSPHPLPSLSLSAPHLVLQPRSVEGTWVSIDGEIYETMPISVRALTSAFRTFTRRSSTS